MVRGENKEEPVAFELLHIRQNCYVIISMVKIFGPILYKEYDVLFLEIANAKNVFELGHPTGIPQDTTRSKCLIFWLIFSVWMNLSR